MERGCEERVRHPMAGDVDHRDAGLALTGPEIPDDVRPARVERVLNPRVEIEELLEIEIDDQIAADRPAEGERPAEDVDAVDVRDVSRRRDERSG